MQSDTGDEKWKKIWLSGSPLISGKIPIFPFIRITGALPIRTTFWAAGRLGIERGTSRKTLILTGHYDAVEIDCYGEPAARSQA